MTSSDGAQSSARSRLISSTLNNLLIFSIVVAILFLAREVLMPIALAGILSFMLAPLVRVLQGFHFPRGLAVGTVVLLAFAAIFALGGVLARSVTQLAGDLPQYQATINAKIRSLRGGGEASALERARQVLEHLGSEIDNSKQKSDQRSPGLTTEPHLSAEQNIEQDRAPIAVEVHEPIGGPLKMLSSLVSPMLGPLATTGLIVVFIVFILIQREDLRSRFIRLVGSTDIPHTTAAIDDAAHRLSHLFLTQLAINTAFAIVIGLGLWFIGIPSPVLWGVLAGILRFIPYVGSILGAIFPLVLAVSVDPGWSMVLWTGALFLGLEALTGQVIEPIVEGHTTGLSPVAIVLAATFWTWVWGPVGLVLATPLTVILVVLGRHVEALKFLNIMFGDEPALSDAECFYQRMLGRNPVEAVEHAKQYVTTHSLAAYCDEIAKPALMLGQKDAERGILNDDSKKTLHQTVESLFAEIAHEHPHWAHEARVRSGTMGGNLPVLDRDQLALSWRSEEPLVLVGVHTELDEAAAIVLATLARAHGIATRIENPQALAAANLANLDLSGAALICLSSADLKTPAHIHYAARRMRSRAPHAALLLAVWSSIDDKTLADLKDAVNAEHIARTFHEAVAIILEKATERQEYRIGRLTPSARSASQL